MADSISDGKGWAAVHARLSFLQSFAIAYGVGLLIVLVDIADGRRFHADVDDQLRELQIRFLMSGKGGWYDLTLPFIASPDPYVSPWSRLVDLPYLLLAKGAALVAPVDVALSFAFWIWPLAMLAIFSLLSVSTVRRLLGGMQLPPRAHVFSLVLMMLSMIIAVLEFAPGRIDHHNVQILALLLMVLGAARWDGRGGLFIGIGSAVSVVIGLECLPFVAAAYAVLTGAFIYDVRGAREVLFSSAVGMAIATVVGAAAFLGSGVLSTQCDAFSAPYVALMLGFSVILGLSARFAPDVRSPALCILLLGVSSSVLLVATALSFPACLAGPYAVIDPLSKTYWFDRIWQEHSILYFYGNGQFDLVVLLALVAVALLVSAPLALAKVRSGDMSWLFVYLLAFSAFVLTVVLTRYIRFPSALVPLFIPAVVAWSLDPQNGRKPRRALVGSVAYCIALFGMLTLLVRPFALDFDAADYMTFDECKGQDFSLLDSVVPGRIAAPNGLSLPILFAAPDGFSVAATPFHRAAPGMKRMYEAFLASDPAVRKAALAPFDYVAVCRFPLESNPSFAPLYAALSAGKDWPGLVRIAPPVETRFQLFRIDHAALQ